MNFLKKLGLFLIKGAAVVAGPEFGSILNLISGFIPQKQEKVIQSGVQYLDLMAKEIGDVEGVFAAISDPSLKTGSQKLIAAQPRIAAILSDWGSSGILGSHKIKDQAKADAAVKGITSNLADYLSAYGD